VGEAGIYSLFDRSLDLARDQFPWLPAVDGAPAEAPWARLRASLERQTSDTAIEASADLVVTLLGLLGRFIGDDLTLRLVLEVWPDLAPRGTTKETT
jgi:hypothetical protein